MADKIYLEVVTPERAVFAEKADDVVLPGSEGQIDILPGHLPLLTSLGVGEMIVRNGSDVRHFFLEGGYAEVLGDKVTVLTEVCTGASDMDVDKARASLADAEAQMLRLEELSLREMVEEELFQEHRDALHRERERLAFAQEQKRS